MGDANTMQSMRLVLQRLPILIISMDSGDEDPVLTVRSAVPGPTLSTREWFAEWRGWVEAMELLAVVWQVDKHAWLQLVTEKGGKPVRGYKTRDGKVPAYVMHLPITEDNELIRAFLNAVFTPIGEEEHSEAFRVARASLLAQGGTETNEPIPVGIVVSDERTRQRELITRWYETVRDTPLRCSLTGVGFLNATTSQGIDGLSFQVEGGVSIGRADLWLPRGEAPVTRHELNKLLTYTFGASGAKWLNIVSTSALPDATEALFSKLTGAEEANAGVRSLVFGVLRPSSEYRSALLLLLYGLFSQDARHSIDHLFYPIFRNFRMANDIRWLTERLRRHGALRLEYLFVDAYDQSVDLEAPTHDEWLIVPSGYPIHVQLGGDSPDHKLTFEDQEARFRVVRDDPSLYFVDILVPGYGLCWVRRSETLAIETTPLTEWTFNQHSIRSMEIEVLDVGNLAMDNLLELLGLVGEPVQLLCITRRLPSGLDLGNRFLGVEQLTSLLHCCPRLEKLRLVNVEVLELALQELFELQECNLEKIELSGHSLVRRGQARALILALANPNLRISRTLRELWLDMSYADLADRDGEESLMTCVLDMLTINQVLTTVSLHVSPSHLEMYGPQLRAIREKILSVRKAPLTLSAKCALLSVVDHTGLSAAQDAIANVFEFAAECETRVVTVTTSSRDPQ